MKLNTLCKSVNVECDHCESALVRLIPTLQPFVTLFQSACCRSLGDDNGANTTRSACHSVCDWRLRHCTVWLVVWLLVIDMLAS